MTLEQDTTVGAFAKRPVPLMASKIGCSAINEKWSTTLSLLESTALLRIWIEFAPYAKLRKVMRLQQADYNINWKRTILSTNQVNLGTSKLQACTWIPLKQTHHVQIIWCWQCWKKHVKLNRDTSSKNTYCSPETGS